jgi:hypothetical protein
MVVKPKAGLTVRHPMTKYPIPAEGAEVQPGVYWTKRLRDGDVTIVDSPPKHSDSSGPSSSSENSDAKHGT